MTVATPTAPVTCPSWCTKHIGDEDGTVIHEGAPTAIPGTGFGSASMRLSRYDSSSTAIGDVTVSLDVSPAEVDLTVTGLRQFAAVALHLAEQLEVTR